MVARWWVRFAVWLGDGDGGDGGDGGEAEWVMLFMKCNESQCVPNCGKCIKTVKNNHIPFFEKCS